jgi:hypothetical protein
MTIEQIRAQMTGAIWQAFVQSGVNLTSVSQEDQEKLVRVVTDRVMLTMNSVLDEVVNPEAMEQPLENMKTSMPARVEVTDGKEETVLWQARPFLSLVEEYILTNERIKVVHGMLSRRIENYELIRIQDIDYKQNVSERVLGIGDIFIRGQDKSNPEIVLRNVAKVEEVYETLRRAWMDARKKHGLQFREYM